MIHPTTLTVGVFVVSILLVAGIILRPEMTVARAGKILAFIALFLLPLIAGGLGLSTLREV